MKTTDWIRLIETEGGAAAVHLAHESATTADSAITNYTAERGASADEAAADLTRALRAFDLLADLSFLAASAAAATHASPTTIENGGAPGSEARGGRLVVG